MENLSLEQLVGPATVCDFTSVRDFEQIETDDLKAAIGDRPVKRLILRFDWDDRLNTNEYYSHHPYLTESACQWLVDQGCRLLAMDTPQPDNPKNGRTSANDSPNHKILLGAGVVLVEYLVRIRDLSLREVFLVVAPLKVANGDGAPVRCFAMEGGLP